MKMNNAEGAMTPVLMPVKDSTKCSPTNQSHESVLSTLALTLHDDFKSIERLRHMRK